MKHTEIEVHLQRITDNQESLRKEMQLEMSNYRKELTAHETEDQKAFAAFNIKFDKIDTKLDDIKEQLTIQKTEWDLVITGLKWVGGLVTAAAGIIKVVLDHRR